MMTVRFPNGQAIQYNDARHVNRHNEFTDLYTCEDGRWIAQVPNSCIIEGAIPCQVYNPLAEHGENLEKEITLLRKQLRKLSRELSK